MNDCEHIEESAGTYLPHIGMWGLHDRATLGLILILGRYGVYGASDISHRFSKSGRVVEDAKRGLVGFPEDVPVVNTPLQYERSNAFVQQGNFVRRPQRYVLMGLRTNQQGKEFSVKHRASK